MLLGLESFDKDDDHKGVSIVEFLSMNGADLSVQTLKTYDTALHVALKKELKETSLLLIKNGCDVNAIAINDVMPLNIVDAMLPSKDRDELLTALNSR
jgi:hypothetical protein